MAKLKKSIRVPTSPLNTKRIERALWEKEKREYMRNLNEESRVDSGCENPVSLSHLDAVEFTQPSACPAQELKKGT